MPTNTVIRLGPKLSIAAPRAKLDRELARWYCLRARNHWGSRLLDLKDAADTLVSLFGYSASVVCRILSGGDGLFWTKWPMKNINSLQIEICGVKRSTGYSGYPYCSCLAEIPILNSVR